MLQMICNKILYDFLLKWQKLQQNIKTHGRVSCCQESVCKARATHVCYLREPKTRRFLPFVVQKLLSRFLPNLYILCPTYT